MLGTKRNLRHALEIRDSVLDPKIKLEAIRIANECYKFIMELSTNGMVISDAIKFVTQAQQKIDTLQKLDECLQQQEEEEEKATEGVFLVQSSLATEFSSKNLK
jgi:hypothetical protein